MGGAPSPKEEEAMFRKKKRCRNLCPSQHPAYAGRRCVRDETHDGVCRVKVGAYYHCWNQQFYERRGQALTKDN